MSSKKRSASAAAAASSEQEAPAAKIPTGVQQLLAEMEAAPTAPPSAASLGLTDIFEVGVVGSRPCQWSRGLHVGLVQRAFLER